MASTPEVSLRITAQDGASDILRKIQAQLTTTGNSVGTFNQKVSTEGVAGLGKLSSGFEHLARSALGFGRAEASIAVGFAESIGATLPILLGVAATVGIVVEAMHFFEKAAKEADDAYQHFMDGFRKSSPLAIIGAKLDQAQEKLEGLQEVLKTASDPGEAYDAQQKVNAQQAVVNGLQLQYGQTLDSLHAKHEKTLDDLGKEKTALVNVADGWGKYTKALEEAVNARASMVGTPNLGDSNLNPGQQSAAFASPGAQEHDSGLMRGHAGEPEFALGFGPEDLATIGDANKGLAALSDTMQNVQDMLPDIAAGFGDVFQQLGANGFDAAAKSFEKFIGQLAAAEGQLLILKGLGKIADGIFPTNPALIASGVKLIAVGSALEVLSGVLGAGGSRTASGGSGGGTTAPVNTQAQGFASKGVLTISVPRNAYASWRDPGFQEFIAKTVAEANGRGVSFATR